MEMEKYCKQTIDQLGRVLLPMEVRGKLNINPKSELDIYSDGESIVLKISKPACVICGNLDGELIDCRKKVICSDCIAELNNKKSERKHHLS